MRGSTLGQGLLRLLLERAADVSVRRSGAADLNALEISLDVALTDQISSERLESPGANQGGRGLREGGKNTLVRALGLTNIQLEKTSQ